MSGEIRTTSKCEPCGSGGSWGPGDCTNAFGNEWDYAGENGCNYDCKVSKIFPGTTAKCRHVRYNADKTSCCIGSPSGGSCNPNWQPGNGQCDAELTKYCSIGDRLINDGACVSWRNQRPDATKQLMFNYCKDRLDKQECREWCKANGGICDTSVTNWCKSHPTDPYCSCIMSPLQDPKFGINPKCNDRKCIDTGYITQNMQNTACPDITNCEVQTKLLNSGVSLAGVTINQSCGSGNTGTDTETNDAPATTLFTSSQLIILFLFLVLIMIATMIAVVFDDSSDGSFW